MSPSSPISPTAHYTGQVWARNGLSHPELDTRAGRLMFQSLRPVMMARSALGEPTLEQYLLARHAAIDAALAHAVEKENVSQVIEVAAGMSARGWRFTERYGEQLTYIEADLPDMAERKRRALKRMGALGARHRVATLDALREEGPHSLPVLAGQLDHRRGLAIITEGLLGYLPDAAVQGIWLRFAEALKQFPTGRYITDIHLAINQTPQVRFFRAMLSAFVRGRVHLHFETAEETVAALDAAGFARAELHPLGPLRLAQVAEAWT